MKKLLHRINLFSPRDIMTCDHIIGIILNRFDVFRSKLKALWISLVLFCFHTLIVSYALFSLYNRTSFIVCRFNAFFWGPKIQLTLRGGKSHENPTSEFQKLQRMTDVFFVNFGQLRTILEINADLVWFVRISGNCATFALQIQSHVSNQHFQYSSQCHESKGSRASQHFDHAEKRRLIAEVFCFANVCVFERLRLIWGSLRFRASACLMRSQLPCEAGAEEFHTTPRMDSGFEKAKPTRKDLSIEMTDLTIPCFKCFKHVWRVRLCAVMFFQFFLLQLSHADLNWSTWRTILKQHL